jgi:hypothetical protein
MRISAFLVLVLASLIFRPMPTYAQSVEIGAGVASSCEPFEYSICHRKWGTAKAVYANWWFREGMAIELRGARLDGPEARPIAVCEEVEPHRNFCRSYSLNDERRKLVQASFVYQFRNAHVFRPFVGGGPGVLWWKGGSSCPRALIECQLVIPNGAPGQLEHTAVSFGFVAGVAFHAPIGVIVRSGIRDASTGYERPPQIRDLPRGLPEYFVSIGYRFGREAPKRTAVHPR